MHHPYSGLPPYYGPPYYIEGEESDERQQPGGPPPGPQPQFSPGFPGFPGLDLERRVRRLEGEVNRLARQVDNLNRRVRRLEGGFPWGS